NAPVVLALYKRMDGIAVGRDGRHAHLALFVLQNCGLRHTPAAAPSRLPVRKLGIIDRESDVAHAITVELDMLGNRMVGKERGSQYEPDLSLLQDKRRPVARPGLRSRICNQLHAECRAVVISGLPGIARVEFEAVRPD